MHFAIIIPLIARSGKYVLGMINTSFALNYPILQSCLPLGPQCYVPDTFWQSVIEVWVIGVVLFLSWIYIIVNGALGFCIDRLIRCNRKAVMYKNTEIITTLFRRIYWVIHENGLWVIVELKDADCKTTMHTGPDKYFIRIHMTVL